MNAARVRIWARPKHAPHLRVEVAPPNAHTLSPCMRTLVKFTRGVADFDQQPHAILACALRWDGTSWEASATWQSDIQALPLRMLPALSAQTVLSLMTRNAAIEETMERLGYQPASEPDPAA